MAEIRVTKTRDGDDDRYGYTVIRNGVQDPPSPYDWETAEEAEAAGLAAASDDTDRDNRDDEPKPAPAKKTAAKRTTSRR